MAIDRDPDYDVGYARPPRQHQFRQGCSGNPRGRPRGAKNLATLLDETLNEKVHVNDNGKRKTISKRQAILKQLVNKAAGGDPRSIQLLLGEIRLIESRADSAAAATGGLAEADREVLAQIYRRLQAGAAGQANDGDPE
jgi:hypothetical protein